MSEIDINKRIQFIRGKHVLLDMDIAELYGIETKKLKQAVRRNMYRFPTDFMFEMTNEEYNILRSQIVTSNGDSIKWLRYRPFVFTEHWILMLANVLRSKRAIEVSIHIIRVFNAMRAMVSTHYLLQQQLNQIEQHVWEHDQELMEIWFELKKLMHEAEIASSRKIGCRID